MLEENAERPNIQNGHVIELVASDKIAGEIRDNRQKAAGLINADKCAGNGHRHDDNHLHEIRCDNGPSPARHRHEHDNQPGHDNGGFDIHVKNRRGDDGQTVQPDTGADCRCHHIDPGKDLLIAFAEAQLQSLNNGHHAHLPKPRREIEIVKEKAERIADENKRHRHAIRIGLACRAGEGPSRKLGQEGRRADHPPKHIAAAAKIIAGVFRQIAERPANQQKKGEINNDDECVQIHGRQCALRRASFYCGFCGLRRQAD